MFNTAVSLICNPAAPALGREAFERTLETLQAQGVVNWTANFLSPEVAAEFHVASRDPRALREAVKFALGDAPIDVAALSLEGRRKKLLVADMDSTIIEQECLDELADFAGLKTEIAAITERAMRGELDFETALKERVGMLKGLRESALEETFRTRITLTPGARVLTATMKRRGGARAALVSGGFTFFTSRVAETAGFDVHDANVLLVAEGALAGAVGLPIKGRAAKEEALLRYGEQFGVAATSTIAVGDGANDLQMLTRAGLGVAFRAKPAVADAAAVRIDHGDLTALLYLQGYSDKEFVR
jgi:phosphoserine phosphatase